MKCLAVAALCVFALAASAARAEEPALKMRWVYLQQNLQVEANLPKIEALLARAEASGYNGVVLADYKLNILDRVPDHYFRHAERFKAACTKHNLEIIPAVGSFGYSSGILAHDPNLAEGLPARNVPLVVRGSEALPGGQTESVIAGSFEEHRGDKLLGWDYQDEPGSGTFVDAAVKHGGQVSLGIENPPGKTGNRRVSKLLKVQPWSQWHASVWIKAEDFQSASSVRMFAMSPQGCVLSHSNLGVKRTQDWTEHHVVFNTLDNSEVRFYLGVWDCQQGKLWLDDARLVEAPFVNLVRRPGCPLVVTDESVQMTYEEGRDFEPLADPKLGQSPWAGEFDVYHEPPKLKVKSGSRIKDGQKLLVSYYHAVTIYDGQVPCSLSEPKVFEIFEDQVRRTEKLFAPKTYFLSHDEIRVANWSADDEKAGLSAGQLLAKNIRQCCDIVRKVNPDARLCVWSDMFDPHHNARDGFYLVNGDLAGSWEGLPRDMIIVNWNSGESAKSLPFFAERGHRQVLAGYYDSKPENIRGWLAEAAKTTGVEGAMYTTWHANFTDLEKFAAAAGFAPAK